MLCINDGVSGGWMDLHRFHAGLAQCFCDPFSRLQHIAFVFGQSGDAGNPKQVAKFLQMLFAVRRKVCLIIHRRFVPPELVLPVYSTPFLPRTRMTGFTLIV
ncbi:hypothetical protein D3C81_1695200 [compost metagenome]